MILSLNVNIEYFGIIHRIKRLPGKATFAVTDDCKDKIEDEDISSFQP